jgi:hypothetical protein
MHTCPLLKLYSDFFTHPPNIHQLSQQHVPLLVTGHQSQFSLNLTSHTLLSGGGSSSGTVDMECLLCHQKAMGLWLHMSCFLVGIFIRSQSLPPISFQIPVPPMYIGLNDIYSIDIYINNHCLLQNEVILLQCES